MMNISEFEAEGQEFAKFMRSLDAKWNKDLGCRNLQEQVRKYSKQNLKPYLKYLTDYYPRKQSSTNLSFILYDDPEIFFVTLHGLKKWPRRFLSLIYYQFVIICVT